MRGSIGNAKRENARTIGDSLDKCWRETSFKGRSEEKEKAKHWFEAAPRQSISVLAGKCFVTRF